MITCPSGFSALGVGEVWYESKNMNRYNSNGFNLALGNYGMRQMTTVVGWLSTSAKINVKKMIF